ncbi:fimbrial protein [Escherichia coli]|nr:fimbrial protein [Escherichia coli]
MVTFWGNYEGISQGEVTLGTPVVITFNNTNSYQELNFKARMESPSKDATPGNVYAQADYKIAYE